MKRLIMDLDNTISINKTGNYAEATPVLEVIEKMREYKNLGFDIVIFSSRNMRTYEGNLGKINANTLPVIIEWLNKHDVPYDEIYVGKAWCGNEGFYVDDRAIRPREFTSLPYEEIVQLMKKDKI
ncbi:MAG: HAD-IIIC family phosphatase [Succinivibrionaceae bacterium]